MGGKEIVTDIKSLYPKFDPNTLLTLDQILLTNGNASEHFNPVLNTAIPLIQCALALDSASECESISNLRQRLLEELKVFSQILKETDLPDLVITSAPYLLCTWLDEIIAQKTWGIKGHWSGNSLLVACYQEASGGENVFLVLQSLAEDARAHIDCLELYFVCLGLGFQGRYRLRPDGKHQIEILKKRILKLISEQRSKLDNKLSSPNPSGYIPHWTMHPLIRVKKILIGALAIALLIYITWGVFYFISISEITSSLKNFKIIERVYQIPIVEKNNPLSFEEHLNNKLQKYIANGLIKLYKEEDKIILRIKGQGLFDSGQAIIAKNKIKLIIDSSNAIPEEVKNIKINGHTDAVLIKNDLYKNNQDLSLARARAVEELIDNIRAKNYNGLNKTIIQVEGFGSNKPINIESSSLALEENRRIEIEIFDFRNYEKYLSITK